MSQAGAGSRATGQLQGTPDGGQIREEPARITGTDPAATPIQERRIKASQMRDSLRRGPPWRLLRLSLQRGDPTPSLATSGGGVRRGGVLRFGPFDGAVADDEEWRSVVVRVRTAATGAPSPLLTTSEPHQRGRRSLGCGWSGSEVMRRPALGHGRVLRSGVPVLCKVCRIASGV